MDSTNEISDTEYYSDSESVAKDSSVVDDESNVYISSLIEEIIESIPEGESLDKNEIYKSFVKLAKRKYDEKFMQLNDPLWSTLEDYAGKFEDKNKDEHDLKIEPMTAFEHALRKYKCVLKQEIKMIIDEYTEDDDNVSEDFEPEDSPKELLDNRSDNNQTGTGGICGFLRRNYH